MHGFGLLSGIRGTWRAIILDTYRSWRSHRTIRLGAGLAYYGLFAIVPLLSISIAVAGIVLDDIDIEEAIAEVLGDIVDADADEMAVAITDSVGSTQTITSLGLIGLGTLMLAASLVFVALQDAFDKVWEVPYRSGAKNTIRRRALAFAVVLLSGAVLVASIVVNALSSLVRSLAPGDAALLETTADLFAVTGSWALAAIALAALFRFLTAAQVHWTVALAGGMVTAFALTVGNGLMAEYLSRYGSSSLAGAAGSVLLGLVWVYAIAQIVLVGAELTRTLELTLGGGLDDASDTADSDAGVA